MTKEERKLLDDICYKLEMMATFDNKNLRKRQDWILDEAIGTIKAVLNKKKIKH